MRGCYYIYLVCSSSSVLCNKGPKLRLLQCFAFPSNGHVTMYRYSCSDHYQDSEKGHSTLQQGR